MKPLHKMILKEGIATDYSRHIRVKDAELTVYNNVSGIIMPAKDVFGTGVIDKNEELFFEIASWEASKLHKAVNIGRDGNCFFAFDKKGIKIGTIEAKSKDKLTYEYPEFKVLLDNKQKIKRSSIGINTKLLNAIAEAWGADNSYLQVKFYTDNMAILTGHNVEGTACCRLLFEEHAFTESDFFVDDLL
ncbi:MAG: hypothetical protein JSS64_06985 [Bacteroidetes bacterium]|nr:hypothetical protein [Bacteroidota bacterium]